MNFAIHRSGVGLCRGNSRRPPVTASSRVSVGGGRLCGLSSPCLKRRRCDDVSRNFVVRAVEDEEADPRDVDGYDAEKGGLLDSEAFATFLKVAFAGLIVGGIALLVFLSEPVIDNTIGNFPGSKG
ncbi:hypothetical protein BSKO_04991 [Bryopsis sp. KO-2023]|nr:hypothetical protein BSKO_04991 [Bryopsis sp. KO-2023]